MLGDAEFEKNFNCNIEKALASPNRGTVLKVIKLDPLVIIYRERVINNYAIFNIINNIAIFHI